jgi:3-dehydroquinate synthetase
LYQHGEAVALGMRAAASISVRMKLLDPMVHFRIETLLTAFGLPENIEGCSLPGILSAMRFDKKFSGKTNRFVLARDIGDVVLQEGVDLALISAVVGKMLIRRRSSRLLSH